MDFPPAPRPAVAGVITDGADRVLLIRRGGRPERGSWAFPGGKQEFGETMFEAVVREVAEETGLAVQAQRIVHVADLIGQDWHFVVVDVLCRVIDGELQVADDAAEAGWFSLEQALGLPLASQMAEALRAIRW